MDLAAGFSKELTGQYLGPQQRIAAQHLQWQLQRQWQLLHLLPCARCCTLWKRSSSLTNEHPMWSVAAWEKHNLSLGCLCAWCRERSNFVGAALGSCCGQHKTSRKHEPSGVSTLPLWRVWVLGASGAAAGARAGCWRPLGGRTFLQGSGFLRLKSSCWGRWWVLHCTQGLRNVLLRPFWAVVPVAKTMP